MQTDYQGRPLRPIGTIKGPDGFNGETYTGTLALGHDERFWVYGTNRRGQPFKFSVTDYYAARYCTGIGTAHALQGAA
jgi:hypothetical protein